MGRRRQGQGHRPARGPRRLRRQVQRRQQRRPHGRRRRGKVRAAPAALRHPDPRRRPGHRQRRRRRHRGALPGDRGDLGARRGCLEAADQRERARDHRRTTAPWTRSPSASSASGRSAPPGAASAPPTPTRSTGSASGSRTCSTRTSCARRSKARCTRRTTCWSRSTTAARITVDEIVDDLLGYVERLRPMVADTSLVLSQALDAGKTVLFEAGQATMLDVDHGTYPFVTSSNATSGGAATGSGRRAEPVRARHRHRQGVHHPGRRRPVPHRAARRVRRVPARARLRVRHHHRAPAALRLVRRADRPVRGPRQRDHRLRAHQARRAHRPRAHPGLRRLRGRRRARGRGPGLPERLPPRRARSTRSSPAGPRTSPAPARSRTCRRPRRTTCSPSRR